MLKCSQCSHENDVTRVFCQNCGMRLERPEGTEPFIAGNTPVAGRPTGKKKGFSFPGGEALRGGLWKFLRGIVFTAMIAALLAAFVQMARKPDGIPDAKPANEAQASNLFQGIKAFSQTIYPRALDLTQDQANNYLATRVVPEVSAQSGSILRGQFERAFVVMGNGDAQFFVEQRFRDWPVFLSLTCAPEAGTDEVSGAKIVTMRVTGGGIGRLRLNTRLLPYLQKNLESVIASLPDATDVLRKASNVTFVPGVAKLSWSGTKSPGR